MGTSGAARWAIASCLRILQVDASRGAFVLAGSFPSMVSVHALTMRDTLRPYRRRIFLGFTPASSIASWSNPAIASDSVPPSCSTSAATSSRWARYVTPVPLRVWSPWSSVAHSTALAKRGPSLLRSAAIARLVHVLLVLRQRGRVVGLPVRVGHVVLERHRRGAEGGAERDLAHRPDRGGRHALHLVGVVRRVDLAVGVGGHRRATALGVAERGVDLQRHVFLEPVDDDRRDERRIVLGAGLGLDERRAHQRLVRLEPAVRRARRRQPDLVGFG